MSLHDVARIRQRGFSVRRLQLVQRVSSAGFTVAGVAVALPVLFVFAVTLLSARGSSALSSSSSSTRLTALHLANARIEQVPDARRTFTSWHYRLALPQERADQMASPAVSDLFPPVRSLLVLPVQLPQRKTTSRN